MLIQGAERTECGVIMLPDATGFGPLYWAVLSKRAAGVGASLPLSMSASLVRTAEDELLQDVAGLDESQDALEEQGADCDEVE